ncbi:hypothetical protein C8R47DRAFT_812658 [Mycena vitilis]|nr:hypothetical protein C8R47DRAFT_812658 [Mycena vitilis]
MRYWRRRKLEGSAVNQSLSSRLVFCRLAPAVLKLASIALKFDLGIAQTPSKVSLQTLSSAQYSCSQNSSSDRTSNLSKWVQIRSAEEKFYCAGSAQNAVGEGVYDLLFPFFYLVFRFGPGRRRSGGCFACSRRSAPFACCSTCTETYEARGKMCISQASRLCLSPRPWFFYSRVVNPLLRRVFRSSYLPTRSTSFLSIPFHSIPSFLPSYSMLQHQR